MGKKTRRERKGKRGEIEKEGRKRGKKNGKVFRGKSWKRKEKEENTGKMRISKGREYVAKGRERGQEEKETEKEI